MKINPPSVALLAFSLLTVNGCSSSTPAASTAEEKKAFAGGPPPSNYMSGIQSGNANAQKAATDAAAKNGKP